jgi:hypothetical protein
VNGDVGNTPRQPGTVPPAFGKSPVVDPQAEPSYASGLDVLVELDPAEHRRRHVRDVAAGLSERYGLSRAVALRVADGEVALHVALGHERSTGVGATSRLQILLVIVMCAAGLWLLGRVVSSPNPDVAAEPASRVEARSRARAQPRAPQPPAVPRAPATKVSRDRSGAVLQVRGASPADVLREFCASSPPGRTFEPVALAHGVPPSRGLRVGLIRDLSDLTNDFAIYILRNERSGQWEAGDGQRPVFVALAHQVQIGDAREPL